jgi:chemotaxis protein CheX
MVTDIPVNTKVDEEHLVSLTVNAASELFQMMLGLPVAPGRTYTEESIPPKDNLIVCLIGIAGPWSGTGMVRCDCDFACKIASAMLMTEYQEVNEEVLDAMAEVANMVFGNVKTNLEEKLGNLGLSIPTVVFGSNFATRGVGKQTWNVMEIQSGEESLELRIFLSPSGAGSHIPRARPHL